MTPTIHDGGAGEGDLEGRFVSIGAKLATGIVSVLMVGAVVTALGLSRQAKRDLVSAKRTAAEMVSELFALTIAPAVDFGDEEAIHSAIDDLLSNEHILYVAVFSFMEDGVLRIARNARSGYEFNGRQKAPRDTGTSVQSDRIELTRSIVGPRGKVLGVVTMHVSLAKENAEYVATRAQIVRAVVALGASIAVVVLMFVRWQVVGPLSRVARSAKRLAGGDLVRVDIRARDEIGRLAASFNMMAAAITDRTGRLSAANERVQQLLDNMQQAILVFGRGGVLDPERSLQSELLFSGLSEKRTIQDALYPDAAGSVEVEAFRQWMELVFQVEPDQWDEIASLAPGQVLLSDTNERRALRLDFRPIIHDGAILKVMMLAIDDTEKQRLQRAVKDREEEHTRQMATMRKLLAGGGQVLVSMLQASHSGVAACERLLNRGDIGAVEVATIFRRTHTIKGEARVLDLVAVERQAAAFESFLSYLRTRIAEGLAVSGEEVGAIARHLRKIQDALIAARTMLVKASPLGETVLDQVTVRRSDVATLVQIAGEEGGPLGEAVERLASRPFGEHLVYLVDALPAWAEQEGKKVLLQIEGGEMPIPPSLAQVLSGILTHLSRNSIAHGIETIEQREINKKPVAGVIRIAATRDHGGELQIVVEDDGAGYDFEGLRRAADRLGLAAQDVPDAELPFLDGLSTRFDHDPLSGRGVGLSAVRSDLCAAGFDVELSSRPGLGTQLRIVRVHSERASTRHRSRDSWAIQAAKPCPIGKGQQT